MPLALDSREPPPAAVDREVVLPPIRETDLDRLLKLVPTEILLVYTAAVPLAADLGGTGLGVAVFLVGLAVVPLVLYLDGRTTRQPARWPQYVVRMLVFVAWAGSWPFGLWANERDLYWVRSLAVLMVPLVGAFALRDHSS
jgi:hypothetical protein